MTERIVHAPFSGWLCELAEVPDGAFAGGMVGEGVAIDPADTVVRAPFDGVVVGLARSGHAVTIRSAEGIEVLIHVGLETVALEGRGFSAHVAEGQAVHAGDPLLALDLDVIAAAAASLISPVVVVAGGRSLHPIRTGRRVKSGEPIMTVRAGAASAPSDETEAPSISRRVTVPLPQGLHARPAARIAACIKAFDARVVLKRGERTADATSLVAMMGLGVRDGDDLEIRASGPQAEAALQALSDLIIAGLEEGAAPPQAGPTVQPTARAQPEFGEDGELILTGVTASPGLIVGRALRLKPVEIVAPHDGAGPAKEAAALEQALTAVRHTLERAAATGGAHRRAILSAHLAFLDDPGLRGEAERQIAQGRSAGFAWRQATGSGAELFRAMGDPRMAERADDLLDLEQQVLSALTGEAPQTVSPGAGSVVIADDLLPSQLMSLDGGRIAGLCTTRGGPTSHVAILAAAMGVPALVAVGEALDHVEDGVLVILDADNRRLIAAPSAARQAQAQSASAARARRRAEAQVLAQEDCHTADGVRIEVFANLGDAAEAAPAVAGGAEGCGLLRTEFLFLDRETAPDEDEQLACYQAIADALDGRPLILRTLDAGGDKPLPYLPTPPEDNPALGLRGVRSGLHRPDLLLTQLRAACRIRSKGPIAVMLPMIASVAEVRQVRALLEVAVAETGGKAPLLGVMIETPAAAVTTDLLAPQIDFISIGTNDLTQYALAMDRQNASLAPQLDGLHPAVLRLIERAANGAGGLEWIGVCGGLASDPAAAAVLIGLGVRELSTTPSMTAEIKAVVRSLTLADCRALAAEVLALDSAEAVRALVAERMAATPAPAFTEVLA